jgi:hypothetical protein
MMETLPEIFRGNFENPTAILYVRAPANTAVTRVEILPGTLIQEAIVMRNAVTVIMVTLSSIMLHFKPLRQLQERISG